MSEFAVHDEFPEGIDSCIGDYFIQLENYLNPIREEKVWKTFKLRDAEFNYVQAKSTFPQCFHPMIGLLEIEVLMMRWSMCQTEENVKAIIKACDETLKINTKVMKIAKEYKSKSKLNINDWNVYLAECQLIEAEISVIQASAEFKNFNYMSAAHTLVKSRQKYRDVSSILKELLMNTDKKYRVHCILQMCNDTKTSNGSIDKSLLDSLQKLIDEKSGEIRSQHRDRHAPVPDHIIQATRDLLQLKQLYRELSGKWKSSDGHADNLAVNQIDKDKKADIMKSPVATKGKSAKFKTPGGSVKDENVHPNIVSFRSPVASNSPNVVSPNNNSSIKTEYSQSPSSDFDGEEGKSVKRSDRPSILTFKSPKKIGVPVVNVLLPRLRDVTKLFEKDVQPQESQHSKNAANRLRSLGRKSFYFDQNQLNTNQYDEAGNEEEEDSYEEIEENVENESVATTSPINQKYPTMKRNQGKDPLFEEITNFQSAYQSNNDNFYRKFILKAKARVVFFESLLSIGISLLPRNISWMLNIVGMSSNIPKSLSNLYSIHNFEESKWSGLATLFLLNLPASFLYATFEGREEEILKIFPDAHIHLIEQFRPLIEAQCLLKSWTSKNPLWLCTAAKSTTTDICSNLHTRLDFFRRAMDSEKDAFNMDTTSNGYYTLHLTMAKHFLSIGHWTKAITAGRQVPKNLTDEVMKIESFAIMRAGMTAFTLNEEFNQQTKFMQLKFTDKIVYNPGLTPSTGLNSSVVSVSNLTAAPSTNVDNKDIMNNIFLSSGQIKLLSTQSMLQTFQTSKTMLSNTNSLFFRLFCYDQYHDMLKLTISKGEDIINKEYLCHWSWLLPAELIYLSLRKDGYVSESSHSVMLQMIDKGAVLFAWKYLVPSSSEKSSEHLSDDLIELGNLITSIVIDELPLNDPNVLRKAILPNFQIKMYYEHVFVTGYRMLRLGVDDIPIPSTSSAATSSHFWNFASAFGSEGNSKAMSKDAKALQLLKKIKSRQDEIHDSITKMRTNEELLTSDVIVEGPKNKTKVVGEVVLTWLLIRGLILMELNRLQEAAIMFKLVDKLKDSAPRSCFLGFVSNYHLAELVTYFDVCDNPLQNATEYLKRSCIQMSKSLRKQCYAYVPEYNELIQELGCRLGSY